MQGARDGSGAHGEHVDVFAQDLQALLMADAKALLLIDDQEPEILELDVGGEEAVGADDDIDLAIGDLFEHGPDFLGGAKAAEHFNAHGEGSKAAAEGLKVLEGEDGGGAQDGDL